MSLLKSWKAWSLSLLLFLNLVIWFAPVASEETDVLSVSFLNIGQGDATLITSPTGNQLLIDGGPDGSILRELPKVMKLTDRTIDVVLATHPDRDHINGLSDVLDRYRVKTFIHSGVESESNSIDEALLYLVESKKIEQKLARRGMKIDLGGGAVAEVLFPDRDPKGMETNDASIVLKLTYGKTCFLFTGDSPVKIERYIIGLEKENLECEVLKAGHHGSRTSTSDEFLHFVKLHIVVISAGLDNTYGHPHEEVLVRLQAASTTTLVTSQNGTITLQSDGKRILIK